MNSASESDQAAIRSIFAKTGLESLFDVRTDRRVIRKNHLEFWAA